MTRLLFIGAIALVSCTGAVAGDNRIRTIMYDAEEIVRIAGRTGIQSTIRFAPDERIENIAVGDSSAWQITPNRRASLLFIKPLAATSRTNMTVVTDRRTYMFDLVAGGKGATPLYQLKFSYLEDDLIREQEITSAEDKSPTHPPVDSATPTPSPVRLNFGWQAKGYGKLTPTRIFDDSSSLYLLWSADRPLPAVLTVSDEGREAALNYQMSGDYIVVSPLPTNLMLRYGKQVVTVRPSKPSASKLPAPRPTPVPAAAPGSSQAINVAAAVTSSARVPVPALRMEAARAALASASVEGRAPVPVRPAPGRIPYPTALYSDKVTETDHE